MLSVAAGGFVLLRCFEGLRCCGCLFGGGGVLVSEGGAGVFWGLGRIWGAEVAGVCLGGLRLCWLFCG